MPKVKEPKVSKAKKEEAKKGGTRTSPKQMEIIVAAIEENPYLNGKKTSSAPGCYSWRNRALAWKALATKLNCSGGASKKVKDWQKTWYDKKCTTKARVRAYNEELRAKQGFEIDPSKELDPLEKRIAALIRQEAIAAIKVEESEAAADVGESNIVWEESNIEFESTNMCDGTDDIAELLRISDMAQEMVDPPSDVKAPYRATPADVKQTPGLSRCTEPCSTPAPSMPTEPLPNLALLNESTKPGLRSSHRSKNIVLTNSSANTICEGTVAMAEAFNKCAAALERANALEEQKQERKAAHNAALIKLKQLKVEALLKIAAGINKVKS